MLGSMATLRLPGARRITQADAEALHTEMGERAGVEASIVAIDGRPWVRVSAAIYNELDDLMAAGRAAADIVAD